MGGKSDEREISLSTGRQIMSALDQEKYDAFAVDTACIGTGGPEAACLFGGEGRPDVAFIALHGKFGEDGTIQGLLELVGIPYVGSGVLASALAMDKIMARKMLAAEGIPVPGGLAVDRCDRETLLNDVAALGYPVVVKPSRQGSTIGLGIARDETALVEAVETALKYDSDVLLEQFVSGIEITAPVLGNDDLEVLPMVEIIPEGGFYDYHAKYTPGATEEIVPARLSKEIYVRCEELATACHRALGCEGMSRTDMIISGEDIYVLEVNTIPGMTPTSLLPRSAQAAGIEFPALLDRLIGYALERCQ